MPRIKLIDGEEISSTVAHKDKTFSIGSKLRWGNKMWVVVGMPHTCASCYFSSYGKCYRAGVWLEELGACTAISRADNENVIFQLRNLIEEK